ncbi:MAG: Cysteine desulfurase [Candidatus Moranbacteria bacterium GW2011_GWE1_35_17]|nr:MAG: Cysteine desulfurase [Candidatus Moranbacteria bacterium GW2011_GWE2_35_164]KKP68538.1 MAG: Cysteine desulfurase [Candidatus Moranbacteria bacterium GW2011_GWE1_35_17]KKP81523.1 MAG: Cysteine desulfurase [Candidatus Moranbacteria bacterium GW2011_GWF1_35_5]KKP81598.1 MAG: Cysteine desulfurase [Candidatus Moranbacteria bacterium GW2011_GWF2_35_54]
MQKKIYLDYAATTPVDKETLEKMMPYFSNDFGNPSSVHNMGQTANAAIDETRNKVAKILNSKQSEIIFTSGATESNNLAIRGTLSHYCAKNGKNAPKPHFITSTIEHHCVLETIESLEKAELIEATFLPVDSEGLIDLEKLKSSIRDNTLLISIMYVNNEIGTIQPIVEIGNLIKELNSNRKNKIIFHSDAVQALNYLDCDTKKLGVDMLSFSAHKFYGPKGAGALYIKKGTPFKSIQTGGVQEFKLRAGTQNVPAIVGLGIAVDEIKNNNALEIKKLRDYLIERVLKEIPASYLNGHREKRSPNNANFRFDNIEGEGLLLSLDMEGICASTGSACSSGSLDPSHVLLALGLRHEQAHGSLRLTLGKHTTREEIDFTIEKIKEIVARLRQISGNVLSEFK